MVISIHDYWENHSFDYTDICWQSDVSAFNMLSRFIVPFFPRSKHLLISWLVVTVHTDFGAQEDKICHRFQISPSICHEVMGLDAMIFFFFFLILNFKPAFSLSSFTLIKRLFSSSFLSAIRVVLSAEIQQPTQSVGNEGVHHL